MLQNLSTTSCQRIVHPPKPISRMLLNLFLHYLPRIHHYIIQTHITPTKFPALCLLKLLIELLKILLRQPVTSFQLSNFLFQPFTPLH
ncbi:hypothetical protein OIU84_020199 [Salix udensis]|uniref:Uncharacterized protein n=1 Tax=Salix udensis TaxID=889485 RepID=A0AAD6L0N7_9ROSI|nr:hypothetical protein OIU84_020199 [Salix udensis]